MKSTKGRKPGGESSYTSSHLNKMKTKDGPENGGGGKMTKFRSLDDIPDSFPDASWSDLGPHANAVENIETKVCYTIGSTSSPQHAALATNLEATTLDAQSEGTVPPLPYDLISNKRMSQVKEAEKKVSAPIPPKSKYFDYDEDEEEYNDYVGREGINDEVPNSDSEQKAKKSSADLPHKQKKEANAGNHSVTAGHVSAPPLPCESKSTTATADDSIFYSKKPRPVEFKPYTMAQYKMIQPKEYVEISNIKPDLNSEELIAKRANLHRVKEFSKNLQKYNRSTLLNQPKLPSSNEKRDIIVSQRKHASRTQKGLEFAKNVPKPKMKSSAPFPTTTGQQHLRRGGLRDNRTKVAGEYNTGYDDFDQYEADDAFEAALGGMQVQVQDQYDNKILELEAQHSKGKAQLEAIRKSMGLK